jgi:SAM-dependent methyltransferase
MLERLMAPDYTCCICGRTHTGPVKPEIGSVRSNVRRFAQERFTLWRCPGCGCIHSAQQVDLAEYYRHYPFFDQKLDILLRWGYQRLLRRLERAGLRKNYTTLDYGCGSGLLVTYMREKGYNAFGYDPYSADHGGASCLNRRYDFVIAQDVVEHAEEPLRILRTLDSLAKPGGRIAIGTPNAAGINLAKAEKFIHPLHQPYHRHIFSIQALQKAGADLSWRLIRYYKSPYTNMPLLSLPFLHHYMKNFGGNLEVLFDKPQTLRFWLRPKTLPLLLLGYFLCDEADIVAIFQKPAS